MKNNWTVNYPQQPPTFYLYSDTEHFQMGNILPASYFGGCYRKKKKEKGKVNKKRKENEVVWQ